MQTPKRWDAGLQGLGFRLCQRTRLEWTCQTIFLSCLTTSSRRLGGRKKCTWSREESSLSPYLDSAYWEARVSDSLGRPCEMDLAMIDGRGDERTLQSVESTIVEVKLV